MDDDVRFDGDVALVTGGGRGIGRAEALLLASRGARVVVNNRTKEAADEVVRAIRKAGGDAMADGHDVGTRSGARELVETALDWHGRIDIVLNNAGVIRHRPFEQIEFDDFDEMMRVNVFGTWAVTQAAWPHLVRQGYGRVVITASTAGVFGAEERAHYAASKGALLSLARSLHLEGSPHGIKVNAFCPGAATRMLTDNRDSFDPTFVEFLERHFLSEYVAPAAVFLTHRDCPVSGDTVGAVGGHFHVWTVAETSGVDLAPGDLTLEAIRDAFPKIADREGHWLPASTGESLKKVIDALTTRETGK